MDDKVKIKKVGTFTVGFCLIIIGIACIAAMFIGITVLKYVLWCWPLLLIFIGAEILYYSRREDITLKYDILGIFLIAIIFVTAIFGSIASTALNEFIDNKDYYLERFDECNNYDNYNHEVVDIFE